eukprot:scaffold153767_cov29-Prasinocladus_malaysianus.AAC.1
MSGHQVTGIICPSCQKAHGKVVGGCPDGEMSVRFSTAPNSCGGMICISFEFPQGADYASMWQDVYLPDSAEGRLALRNIQLAVIHTCKPGTTNTLR